MLLQALTNGESYGVELAEQVETLTGVRLGQGSLYPALRSLERDGLVESYRGKPLKERGGRPRKYYRITASGMRAADKEMDSMRKLRGLPEWELAGA